MLRPWLPPLVALSLSLPAQPLEPNLVPGAPGSLSRPRDTAADFLFANSAYSEAEHMHTQDRTWTQLVRQTAADKVQPSTAPTHRTIINTDKHQTNICSPLLPAEVKYHYCKYTHDSGFTNTHSQMPQVPEWPLCLTCTPVQT